MSDSTDDFETWRIDNDSDTTVTMPDTDGESLYTGLQRLSGARFTELHQAGDTIDNDVIRVAQHGRGEAVPSTQQVTQDRSRFHGAVVFPPRAGVHRNVPYIDFASLYPNGMRDINASTDTLIGDRDALRKSPFTVRDVQWSFVDPRPIKTLSDDEVYSNYTNGMYKMIVDGGSIKWRDEWQRVRDHLERRFYVPPEERVGLLPSLADRYIRWNKSYSGTMYKATKRPRNALYGVNGDDKFRLFSWEVAESITIFGRLLLEHACDVIIDYLSNTFDEQSIYRTHGDTDGFGIAVDKDVHREHVMPRIVDAVIHLNETVLDSFLASTFGITDEHHQFADVESFSPRLFIPAKRDATIETTANAPAPRGTGIKKTYAERVTLDESEVETAAETYQNYGFDVVEDISITGFEAKRSDVADMTARVQRDVLKILLTTPRAEAKRQVAGRIRNAVAAIHDNTVSVTDIAVRQGLSQEVEAYGTPTRTPQPPYRGAKYAKQNIDGENPGAGSNVVQVYVDRVVDPDLPSVYNAETAEDGDQVDVIAVEDPNHIPDGISIDREEHIRKTLRDPLRTILETLDMTFEECLEAHEQTGLNAYE